MKSKLKKKDRISPLILHTELSYIQTLIRDRNYGYALEMIESINCRLKNYDWDKIIEKINKEKTD